jgi:hypothetical protein
MWWFNEFKHMVEEYKVDTKNIYNTDETGFQSVLCRLHPLLLTKKCAHNSKPHRDVNRFQSLNAFLWMEGQFSHWSYSKGNDCQMDGFLTMFTTHRYFQVLRSVRQAMSMSWNGCVNALNLQLAIVQMMAKTGVFLSVMDMKAMSP